MKNDLGVDCISRKSVIDELKRYFHDEYYQRTSIQDCRDCFIEDVLNHLPSVTPQLSSGLEKNSKKLEKDFGELDCISREATINYFKNFRKKISWMPLIDVVDRLKEQPSVTKFCHGCGAKMVEPQESEDKP